MKKGLAEIRRSIFKGILLLTRLFNIIKLDNLLLFDKLVVRALSNQVIDDLNSETGTLD